MKKLLAGLSLVTMVSIIHIEPLSAEEKKQKPTSYKTASDFGLTNENLDLDGFYIGGTGGGEFGSSKVSTSGSNPVTETTVSNNSNLSHRGVSGGLVAGFGKTVKGIYVGAEVAGELTNASGKSATSTANGATAGSNVSVRKTDGLSIAGRVGKQIDEKTLIYAKAGLASNGYHFSSSINAGGINASSSQNKRILQPIAGLGAERVIGTIGTKIQVRAGAEWEHSFGRTTNVNLNSGNFNGTSKFDSSSDAIKARILFKF